MSAYWRQYLFEKAPLESVVMVDGRRQPQQLFAVRLQNVDDELDQRLVSDLRLHQVREFTQHRLRIATRTG